MCRDLDKELIDKYYQIKYNELNIWIPLELKGSRVTISLNPWPSDLPNRELLVEVREEGRW